ncbi:MAG TPA: LacI family DNA-binding transcriptional regulator [Candidatus Hydrogenedentes bacterium]|nr:LacI family DNA-binding transcriptional regulator [Candidatus Hydrogenedentota bacterium]HOL77732.1 LacI family DNA-binding transcriptional regulator [Candidatus Hydrogenedentota bacterium]HPO86855.1 LacI family DNA-binding transcriptional regulator [Candidatus Hydrogenedentota bacterium]
MKQNNMNWTIYDIAREARVSAKTVSRVLNDKPGVKETTRAKILDIMRKVQYHPHMGARALRGKRQGCIGITVPAPLNVAPLSQSFFIWLFGELFRLFSPRGEYLCFDMNPFAAQPKPDYARGLWQQLYKACIVVGPLALEDKTIFRIHESGVPYVVFGRLDGFPECSYATVDYEEGCYESTKFLIKRGHKRIAMLKAFSGYEPGLERRRGYLRALEEAGLTPDENLIRSVTFGSRNIANVVHRLLAQSDVTALLDCSGVEDGASIREGARRAGKVPGKDFEVLSWTYADNGAVLAEACAHMWLPVREAASEGLELLGEWIDEKRAGPIHVLYRPVLNEKVTGGEIPKPKRLFDVLD